MCACLKLKNHICREHNKSTSSWVCDTHTPAAAAAAADSNSNCTAVGRTALLCLPVAHLARMHVSRSTPLPLLPSGGAASTPAAGHSSVAPSMMPAAASAAGNSSLSCSDTSCDSSSCCTSAPAPAPACVRACVCVRGRGAGATACMTASCCCSFAAVAAAAAVTVLCAQCRKSPLSPHTQHGTQRVFCSLLHRQRCSTAWTPHLQPTAWQLGHHHQLAATTLPAAAPIEVAQA